MLLDGLKSEPSQRMTLKNFLDRCNGKNCPSFDFNEPISNSGFFKFKDERGKTILFGPGEGEDDDEDKTYKTYEESKEDEELQ